MPIPTSVFVTTLLTVLAASTHSGFTCSTQPEDAWVPIDQARSHFIQEGYHIRSFKKTRSNCYKLYGFNTDGKKVDVYFNPVDLSKVIEHTPS
ncbi:PepSY domain-containing protein [Photobacterium rosenbergii]|uniref:PepSY domain-containing protein n=1 Tax=Photobacterium rosenbergii TaxID=294936 RepID=UPI003981C256